MKITKIHKGLLLIAMASGAGAIGCELIVDFDRTRIPVDTTEASIPDTGPLPEASTDAPADAPVDGEADADPGDGGDLSDAGDAGDAGDADAG